MAVVVSRVLRLNATLPAALVEALLVVAREKDNSIEDEQFEVNDVLRLELLDTELLRDAGEEPVQRRMRKRAAQLGVEGGERLVSQRKGPPHRERAGRGPPGRLAPAAQHVRLHAAAVPRPPLPQAAPELTPCRRRRARDEYGGPERRQPAEGGADKNAQQHASTTI